MEASLQDLSSYDEYVTEVHSGRLEWSPVHRSERFWRENADRYDHYQPQMELFSAQLASNLVFRTKKKAWFCNNGVRPTFGLRNEIWPAILSSLKEISNHNSTGFQIRGVPTSQGWEQGRKSFLEITSHIPFCNICNFEHAWFPWWQA